MADLTPTPGLDPVYQLETGDPVLAGPGGIANRQAQALLNRDAFLLERIDADKAALASAVGAGMVGFRSSYAGPEAQAQTVFDRLNEVYVSITDFGAVPDAVDNTEAIQKALDAAMADTSKVWNIYVPPGRWNVRCLRYESGNTIRFLGCGESTELRIIGTDADAYSVTRGTTTVTANILFSSGGENKCWVGNFRLRGNVNVSFGIAFHNFFNGSCTPNITAWRFEKDGAVPVTYFNCVSTYVPLMTAKYCSRFIRLVGMADAVHFVKPTAYNFNTAYSQIFNEVGYLTAADPNRYTVQTIFDAPYCYAGPSTAGTFIQLSNAAKVVIRDAWPENVNVSIELANCTRCRISTVSHVSASTVAKVVVTGGYGHTIITEGPVDLGGVEHYVRTESNIVNVVHSGGAASMNVIYAKDAVWVGRPTAHRLGLEMLASGGSATGTGTITSSTMSTYKEGTFQPSLLGGGGNPTVTYTEQDGRFTRIGNVVLFSIRINVATITGGSGALSIGNLPYTAGASVAGHVGEALQMANLPTVWSVSAGGSSMVLRYGNSVSSLVSDVAASSRIRLEGQYFVA